MLPFSNYCDPLVTDFDSRLKEDNLALAPERIHSLLACATPYIGEGATMASEAGVPWIFVYTRRLPYLDDQDKKYGLGYTVDEASRALEIATTLLRNNNLKPEWREKRQILLQEKIEVCEFMTNLIIASSKHN